MLLLVVVATPIFHILFGTKWDEAIPLFQLLALRGIFIVLTSLYNNHILAIGAARKIVYSEVVKDGLAIVAIVATIPFGIEWLVGGQVIAAFVYFIYAVWLTSSVTGYSLAGMVKELIPYTVISVAGAVPAWLLGQVIESPWLLLPAQLVAFSCIYLLINYLLRSRIQQEVLGYLLKRNQTVPSR